MQCKQCGGPSVGGGYCDYCEGERMRQADAEAELEAAVNQGLTCPSCHCDVMPVYYTRRRGNRILRRRKCHNCGRLVTTYERIG